MLPDVAGEQRLLALSQRILGVVAGDDREAAVDLHQPSPSRAELLDRRLAELLLEVGERAEALPDRVRDLAARLASAARLHTVPVEGVVPGLRRVVEQLARRRGADQILERLVRLRLAFGQPVEGVDVVPVVLAVVILERLSRDVRSETALGIGKLWKSKCHDGCSSTGSGATGGPASTSAKRSHRPAWRS